MKIALTGATGFAGRQIVAALLADGHAISALVRKETGAIAPGVRTIVGDLDDHAALGRLCDGADVVVHVAGAIAAKDRQGFLHVNHVGTENVVRSARASSARRIVHISSLAARNPWISNYAESKRAGEMVVQSATTCECLILRPGAIYGVGDKATLPLLQQLSNSVAMIPGNPAARFSLIEVSDFARIVSDSVSSPTTGLRELDDTEGGHTWSHLIDAMRSMGGNPQRTYFIPQSLAHVVGLAATGFARIAGKSALVSPGKIRELYHPDWVAAGPGWPRSNPVLLRDGLRRTMDWYVSEGWIRPGKKKSA